MNSCKLTGKNQQLLKKKTDNGYIQAIHRRGNPKAVATQRNANESEIFFTPVLAKSGVSVRKE